MALRSRTRVGSATLRIVLSKLMIRAGAEHHQRAPAVRMLLGGWCISPEKRQTHWSLEPIVRSPS